jgi:hypothetical protein
MSQLDGIGWFKQQFGTRITQALQGTPFSLDMAAAIAVQETYSDCWGISYQSKPIYQALPAAQVLQICVGDTLDAPNRSAFPKTKQELCQKPSGQEMFTVARNALLAIGQYNPTYARVAKANPDKFCHGYGIFQYDLQYFLNDPGFFLQNGWYDINQCITRLVRELNNALKTAYGPNKTALTDQEMMYVAVAYNCGHVNINGGPNQGFQDDDGNYYGANFQKFLGMAHTVQAPAAAAMTVSAAAAPLPASAKPRAKAPRKPAKRKVAARKPPRKSKKRKAPKKAKRAAAPRKPRKARR